MDRTPVPEAPLIETEAGLRPDGAGWFVLNLADAAAVGTPDKGHAIVLEPGSGVSWEPQPDAFPHFGVNVRVLPPGARASMYHAEDRQEAFLVLEGECVLVVEDQERRLRQWDFVHCAPGTAHVFVGGGEAPCVILMVGARGGESLVFPASEPAARHGASVAQDTASPEEAYAGWEEPAPMPATWPAPSADGG